MASREEASGDSGSPTDRPGPEYPSPPGPPPQGLPRSNSTPSRSEEPRQDMATSFSPTPILHSHNLAGHSRESHMQRSSTPPHTVRYTRTGRVSKATKGQRVHGCEECGKTYTRAEHLRRHRQNHRPGSFLCDEPNCGRTFFREDLLRRHKERHDNPLDPPTRPPSISSQPSGPGSKRHFSSGSRSAAPYQQTVAAGIESKPDEYYQVPPAPSKSPATARSQRKPGYLPLNTLRNANAVPIGTGGAHPIHPIETTPWHISPPYSPSAEYESPPAESPYLRQQPYYAQASSSGAWPLIDTFSSFPPVPSSRSPLSTGSSTSLLLGGWNFFPTAAASPEPQPLFTSSRTSSEAAFQGEIGTVPRNSVFDGRLLPHVSNGCLQMITPEERDHMESEDLQDVGTMLWRSDLSDPARAYHPSSSEERYLKSYWISVHPLFPVVHRPTFDFNATSPLLTSAMLALGAHMLRSPDDIESARVIHEKAQKVLKSRTAKNWHTLRVCDMQAILLIEVFAVFRSRRPPLELSRVFEDMYLHLAKDGESTKQSASHVLFESPMQTRGSIGSFDSDSDYPQLDVKCKQRLLLSCYVLDQQHALLFGRQRASCLANGENRLSGLDLPFGRSQRYRDATPQEHLQTFGQNTATGIPCCDTVSEALIAMQKMTAGREIAYDAFRSTILMSSLTDLNNMLAFARFPPETDEVFESALLVVERTPRMQMAYHTFLLCHYTPIRNLLAVAGESWIMAEKLGSEALYIQSQLITRDWATVSARPKDLDSKPILRAFYHAQRILHIHQRNPRAGLLFQEWSIYLSALVIWARTYVAVAGDGSELQSAATIPGPVDLERSVTATLAADAACVPSLGQARDVLAWTKRKIEDVDVPHNWGLTNGALDVLGKLVARGHERGWFA